MQEIIELLGVILRTIEVVLKVLAFLKRKVEKNRNHPQ
jgi:hypothetical protein